MYPSYMNSLLHLFHSKISHLFGDNNVWDNKAINKAFYKSTNGCSGRSISDMKGKFTFEICTCNPMKTNHCLAPEGRDKINLTVTSIWQVGQVVARSALMRKNTYLLSQRLAPYLYLHVFFIHSRAFKEWGWLTSSGLFSLPTS